MNAWFLVAALVVAFVFGYRFYAKLLALDIFRLDKNYSTPAQAQADGRDYVPTHPHVLFGHHLAAAGGVALFAAPIAAAIWGWVPAFLWITAGSAVAAGTYSFGAFWLSLRQPKALREVARDIIGPGTRTVLFVFAIAALAILVAVCAGVAAALLAAYPAAVLPVMAIAVIALILGSFLHGRAASDLLPACIIAFLACLLALWTLSGTPLAFGGALAITFGKNTLLSIDAVLVWVVLLLVYVFQAARVPVWRVMRPRALLTSLLLLVLLLVFYIGLALGPAAIVAPEFNSPTMAPGALPWLFLIVGPGALAGWQLLIVHHVTAREMRRETDVHYVGYGTALVHGVVALSALLIAVTGFANTEEWTQNLANIPNATDLPRLASLYIEGFARTASALPIDPAFARTFATTIVVGLTLAVLEGAVRALKHLLAESAAATSSANRTREGERARLWAIVVVTGLLAISDGRGLGGLNAWSLFGIISLWLAAGGFALIALALRALGRSTFIFTALGALIAVIAVWSTGAQLWAWWQASAWISFVLGALVLLGVFAVLYELAGAAGRRPRTKSPSALDS